ncbi:hypothetical protein [uncultured Flavobacterium sp.]|uniref:hypothetical protein n=1 Tax=uncultured Flavobacterium sp. TaxID=165435 RepID=UPI0030EF2E07
MITKKNIYLGLSVLVFVMTMFSILTSNKPDGVLDNSLSIQWIILLVFALLLPIFNLAEIIINRNDWSKLYWLGLVFNVLTIIFVMRFFEIGLF